MRTGQWCSDIEDDDGDGSHVRTATRPDAAGNDPAVRVTVRHTPVAYSHFAATFLNAVAAGIGNGSPVRPRVHDLRHSFAVRTLLGWYQAGLDVEALLPRLSTYLGHREPGFTYWYLTATPELLDHAAARLDAAQAVTR